MKKNLLLPLFALLSLAACKKDAEKQPLTSADPKTDSHKTINTVMPTYVDLTLVPRQAGENFDTYQGYWNDCGIKVRGPLVYNAQKYPTLVNGVPVSSMSITTFDGTSAVDYSNTGPDGSVFAVTQVYMGYTDFAGFRSDLNLYFNALDIYNQTDRSGPQPLISDAVKDSYTTSSSAKTYVGKLIRVTTGSNLAIATYNYALPTSTTPSIQPLGDAVWTDPLDNKQYLLHGDHGVVTSCQAIVNGVASGSTLNVSGSYTANTPNSQNFHIWGSLIRANGSAVNFNFNQDTQ